MRAAEVPADALEFRPSVYALILQEGRVLLVPQWDGYDFPGGGIEKGESIEEALLREVKEETGLSVTIGPLLSYTTDFFYDTEYRDQAYHSILLHFLCTDPKGELSADGFDAHERTYAKKAQWIEVGSVDALRFYNGVDSPSVIRKAVKYG